MAVYYLHYAISTLLLLSPFSVSPPPIVFIFAFAYPASCSEPSITSLSTIASICRLQLPPGGLCSEPPSNTKSCAFIGPSIFHDDALFSLSTPRRFDTFLSLFALTHCCHFPFLRLFVSASCSEPSITSLSPGHQSLDRKS